LRVVDMRMDFKQKRSKIAYTHCLKAKRKQAKDVLIYAICPFF
jgi:hypothetical protein